MKGVQRAFSSIRSNELAASIRRVGAKVRLRESVADVKRLQRFVAEKEQTGRLGLSLDRTARYNQEFRSFINEYQDKNRQIPNTIDLTRFVNNEGIIDKNAQMRMEDMDLLEDFRRRRQHRSALKSTERFAEDDTKDEEENAERTEEEILKEEEEIETYGSIQDARSPQVLEKSIFDVDDFTIIELFKGTTTLVTKLNRVNHFRAVVFMGNFNGVIGYGKASGNDFEDAMKKAIHACKRNLIVIPLDHFYSCSGTYSASYNGCKIELSAQYKPKCWGHPLIWHMLALSGITHCKFKLHARNLNVYALLFAFFRLVTQNTTHQDLVEATGSKLYDHTYGRPLYWINPAAGRL
eukprot:TRINITY_DN179_c0_g1_i3.p1 TRINITY_DN179_c0_g1~~TRINITY_DN179_c0_g1_i3.p1  ORF type:complete len:351 (-),score=90.20 TRINITY_DN179_c0_g1_i3:50-1102(-)